MKKLSDYKFGLIGAAGYVAPRHMKAISDTGGDLVAALDKSDSVGVIDRYFPKASFFTEFERFDRHLDKLKQAGNGIDFLSICTPNYLHDSHIRFGLRTGAHVICEKPLVLNPWNIDALQKVEQETGKKVYNILQLRLHPELIALKKEIDLSNQVHDVNLSYITSRGKWYYASWKGNESMSGGISTNIGIHFFDLLSWLFGKNTMTEVHLHTHDRAAGYFEFEKAKVKWFLSINADTLPEKIKEERKNSYRSLNIDQREIDLSYNFEELHTNSYKEILNGNGYRLEDCKASVNIASEVRRMEPIGPTLNAHQFVQLALSKHPFTK